MPGIRLRLALLALPLLLAACAVSPASREALAGYVQAMAEVEQSADVFLTDFSNSVRVREAHLRVTGMPQAALPEYPTTFTPPDGAPPSEAERAVQATRAALEVVHAYNQALVALAEGQSEQAIRQRTTALGSSIQRVAALAGAAVPALGPLAAFGPQILKLAQDASNRQQLEQAVRTGREPVQTILRVLVEQTPAMYRLSVVGTSQAQDKAREDIQRAAAALRSLVTGYAPPTAPEVASAMALLQAELAAVGRRTGTLAPMPVPWPYGKAGRPFDAAARAQVAVFVQSVSTSGQRYAEVIARQNAYYELMKKYVQALQQAGTSLDALDQSLQRPVDLRAEVDRLLKVAAELRAAMQAWRNPATASAGA